MGFPSNQLLTWDNPTARRSSKPNESRSANKENIGNPKPYKGAVERLMNLTANAELLGSPDGNFFAKVAAGSRPEVYALESGAFRGWLIDGYSATCHEVPSDWAIRRVLGASRPRRRSDGGTSSIFIRVGRDGTGHGDPPDFYLDLGDRSGQAVRIGPEGWSLVGDHCVHFQRPTGYLALPEPSRGGSIELLRPYVNLDEADFRLLIVWMAAAPRPVGPYPIMVLYGEPGATKTTLAQSSGS